MNAKVGLALGVVAVAIGAALSYNAEAIGAHFAEKHATEVYASMPDDAYAKSDIGKFLRGIDRLARPAIGIGILMEPAVLADGTLAIKVVEVFQGYPANKGGLRRDDLILYVNENRVPTLEEDKYTAFIEKEIKSGGPGRRITVSVLRGREPFMFTLQTALLRGDMSIEAAFLKERIATEGAAISEKIKLAKDDQSRDAAVAEYFNWRTGVIVEINQMLVLLPYLPE